MIWISAISSMGGGFLELALNQVDIKTDEYIITHHDSFFGEWTEVESGYHYLKNKQSSAGVFNEELFDHARQVLTDKNYIAAFTHVGLDPALDKYATEHNDIVLHVLPGPYMIHFLKRESTYRENWTIDDMARAYHKRQAQYDRQFEYLSTNNRVLFPQQCFMEGPDALSSLVPNFDQELFNSNLEFYKQSNYSDIKNQKYINAIRHLYHQ
mgnify:CR=1 FL=1